MKKINLTLFPVPKKFGMMESPQIDIAQLSGDLISEFGNDYFMCDFRFEILDAYPFFGSANELLSGMSLGILELSREMNEFYEHYYSLVEADIFIFPISVLEQFRIEYLLPPLLFTYLLKKEFPQKKVIFFGNYPQIHAEVLMEKFRFLDAIVLNGDNLALADYIAHEESENIIYRNINNEIILGHSHRIVEINSFSLPNFDYFNLDYYKRKGELVLPYELSRGCLNSCFYCYYIHKGGIVYKKDRQKVLSELKELKQRYKTSLFHFHDAEINFDNSYLEDICMDLIEENVGIFWSALAIPMRLDRLLLQKLYNAGCRQLRFGVESGSQRILDIIGKGTNILEIEEILKNCKEIGIKTYGTIIVDLKQETKEDLRRTLEFLKENKDIIDDLQVCSYGELGNFSINSLRNFTFPVSLDKISQKKISFERFQFSLGITKSDIVEFIRNL